MTARRHLEWIDPAAKEALALLTVNAPAVAWQDQALCAETDPESFFPEKGGSTREAKKVCGACEVWAECLAYALDTDQKFGIWGGFSERERRRLKQQQEAEAA